MNQPIQTEKEERIALEVLRLMLPNISPLPNTPEAFLSLYAKCYAGIVQSRVAAYK
jgi:hypothetical protein